MRQVYLVLWTVLFAFVLYRELLLLTQLLVIGDEVNLSCVRKPSTVQTPPHLLYTYQMTSANKKELLHQ